VKLVVVPDHAFVASLSKVTVSGVSVFVGVGDIVAVTVHVLVSVGVAVDVSVMV
jgi:hypothetical protein